MNELPEMPSTSRKLTEGQARVVDTWGRGVAVMAGAGAGKTSTLIQKIRELLVRNPEARFAAVSFTEKSADDLRQRLTKLTLELQGKPLQGHRVSTIHGLCRSIIQDYPQEAGFEGDEATLSSSQSELLWEQAMESLWFDELPPETDRAFRHLLTREDFRSISRLIKGIKKMRAYGDFALRGYPFPETEEFKGLSGTESLTRVADHVLTRFDRQKKRMRALDYDDLETGADRALRVDYVQEDYRARFDLIVVDEFQDTNPLQGRIVWNLVRPDASNLVVVGDPKQSIYRFRDADVSVFQEFCTRIQELGGEVIHLSTNFRSVPGVLDFCNEICEPAFAASGMEYQALLAHEPEDPSVAPVTVVEAGGPSDLARFIRGEIARGIELSDMALLVRSLKYENALWIRALAADGIPIAVASGGQLWEDPRVRELAHLLIWWDNPAEESSGLTALRAPWIGASDAEIHAWRKIDRSMVAPFLASSHPVARALLVLWQSGREIRPGELLLALLQVDGIQEEMGAAILALWHRVDEFSENGLDFSGVVRRLWLSLEADHDKESSVPPPKSQGQLRVMTIHASKGLEFPHVILIDFDLRAKNAKSGPLLYWDRQDGAYLAGKDEVGSRFKDQKTPDSEELLWKSAEQEKELAEQKRVFYVAVTRAEERVICVVPPPPEVPADGDGKKKKAPEKGPLERDHWYGWSESAIRKAERWRDAGLSGSVDLSHNVPEYHLPADKPRFFRKRPRHSVTEWNTLSRCERAYEWKSIRPREASVELDREWVESERGARSDVAQNEIGTEVHRCLELGDVQGLRDLEKQLGSRVFRADALIDWMSRSPFMREASESFEVWKEFAFEVPVEEEALVGALDRLVYDHETGLYSIVDFKVTARPKSDEDLLRAYGDQLNIYAWALARLEPRAVGHTHAYLIAISQGQVREIEVPLTEDRLGQFKARAQAIVAEETGVPTPGDLCRVCEFSGVCPEGSAFLRVAHPEEE